MEIKFGATESWRDTETGLRRSSTEIRDVSGEAIGYIYGKNNKIYTIAAFVGVHFRKFSMTYDSLRAAKAAARDYFDQRERA